MRASARNSAAAVLAVALLLTACGGGDSGGDGGDAEGSTDTPAGEETAAPAADTGTIRVGVGIDVSYAPFFVAEANGYFEDAGLEVELVQFERGGVAVDALNAGEVQFAGSSGITSLTQLEANEDLRAIAIYEEAGDYIKTVLAEGTDPAEIDTFGIVPGLSEYGAREYLTSVGVDPNEIELVSAGPSELKDILLRGDIDGFVLWEPWPQQAIDQGDAEIVGVSADYDFVYVHWLMTNAPWLEENEEAARAFTDALAQAAEDVEADPEATADILTEAIAVEAEDVSVAIDEIDFGVRGFQESDFERYDRYVAFWNEVGGLEIDWESHVDEEWYQG